MRRFKTLSTLTAVFTVVAVVAAGLAWADEAIADGDQIAGVSASALSFGTVCVGSTVSKDITFALTRVSNGGGSTFKNGSSATVTRGAVAGVGLSAVMNASTITIPPTWESLAIGTISPTVTSKVTLVAGTVPRSLSGSTPGSIVYSATGTNANNNNITRDATLPVTASIVNCD